METLEIVKVLFYETMYHQPRLKPLGESSIFQLMPLNHPRSTKVTTPLASLKPIFNPSWVMEMTHEFYL